MIEQGRLFPVFFQKMVKVDLACVQAEFINIAARQSRGEDGLQVGCGDSLQNAFKSRVIDDHRRTATFDNSLEQVFFFEQIG
jgi:hypothetical protein